jgi:hypothetical protein
MSPSCPLGPALIDPEEYPNPKTRKLHAGMSRQGLLRRPSRFGPDTAAEFPSGPFGRNLGKMGPTGKAYSAVPGSPDEFANSIQCYSRPDLLNMDILLAGFRRFVATNGR